MAGVASPDWECKHDTDSNATRTRRYGMGLAHHQCDVGKPHEATASGRWPFVVQVALKKALNVPLSLTASSRTGLLRRCSDRRCQMGLLSRMSNSAVSRARLATATLDERELHSMTFLTYFAV